MLARDVIVATLTGHLPAGVDLLPYARNIDPPAHPPSWSASIRSAPAKDVPAWWKVEASLVLIEPTTTPGPSDDNLDGLLQDVLYVLDTDDVARQVQLDPKQRGPPTPRQTPPRTRL